MGGGIRRHQIAVRTPAFGRIRIGAEDINPSGRGVCEGTGVEEARTDLRIGVARPRPQMVLGAKESRERHAILRQSRNDMRTTTA